MVHDDLVEKVARAIWMADIEPYEPGDRIPFEEAEETARAYCLAEARAALSVARQSIREECAEVCDKMHELGHDNCKAAAAAIRAMEK
jgi:hypothetical protein